MKLSGDKLREIRLKQGFSQEALAHRAGFAVRTLRRLEQGKSQPQPATLKALADSLGVLVEELWTPTAERAPISSALRTRASNLPAQLGVFIGRETELVALADLVAKHRLVTIIGSGGAGKTRLSLEAAANHTDRFPDGVWWVELAPHTDESKVAQGLADVLGASLGDAGSAADAIVRRLANDRALIVFDNCEHLLRPVAELVHQILRECVDVSLLATSRGALHVPGEFVWRVPSLSLPTDSSPAEESDAVRLFVDCAKRGHPTFTLTNDNEASVVEICCRLDGIPLAIELAAARTRVLRVEQVLDGLSDSLALLTRGAGSSLARHQTLEASIAWSVALLADDEQSLLHRLSVFSGSFDLAAVESVCIDAGRDSPSHLKVLEAIERLLDLSLISVSAKVVGRLTQLETVRQFGMRHLEGGDSDVAAMRRRHADYFAKLAEMGPEAESADELAVAERLRADEDNLRAALVWHRDHGEVDELVAIVEHLAPYWNIAGAMPESHTWTTCALDRFADEPSVPRARLLAHRALACSNLGRYTDSFGDCRAAIEIAEKVGDVWSIGRARWVMADLFVYNDLDTWRPLSQQAVDALRVSGDRFSLAYALVWQAMPYLIRGHLVEGSARLEAAAGPVSELGNPTIEASYRAWHGTMAFYTGDLDRAETLANGLLAGAEFQLAIQRMYAEWLLAASCCYRGVDHPLLAELPERIESARRSGEIFAAVMYQYNYAVCLLFSDPQAAIDLSEDLLARYDAGPYVHIVAMTHLVEAWAMLALDRPDAVSDHIQAAETVKTTAMTWPVAAIPLRIIRSLLAAGTGEFARAVEEADEAIAIAHRERMNLELVHALEGRAVVAVAARDYVRAARIFGAVSKQRDDIGLAGAFLPLSALVSDALERVRTEVGPHAFEAERLAGATLSVGELC